MQVGKFIALDSGRGSKNSRPSTSMMLAPASGGLVLGAEEHLDPELLLHRQQQETVDYTEVLGRMDFRRKMRRLMNLHRRLSQARGVSTDRGGHMHESIQSA